MNRVKMVAIAPMNTYYTQEKAKSYANEMATYMSQTENLLNNHSQMLAMLQNRLDEIDKYCMWVAGTYPEIPRQYNALTEIQESNHG